MQHVRTDIDSLRDNVAYIRNTVEQCIQSVNQNSEIINKFTGTQTSSTPIPQNPSLTQDPIGQIQKVQMLSEAAEGIAKIVTAWKGNPGGAPQGYQMDLVNTIIGAFSKLIQIQVDNAVLNTYPQARGVIEPPDWVLKSKPAIGQHRLA